jgi:hypothetical protein
MISVKHRFIYLHVPKTGGNSISHLLRPHADDQITTRPGQDGYDRFNIRGAITPHKHATLSDCAARLGAQLGNYRIIISVRDPLSRAVSFYFTPSRWMRRTPSGWQSEAPRWDRAAFFKLIESEMTPASAFLTLPHGRTAPSFTLRYESLAPDAARLCTFLTLPVTDLPHVNATAAAPSQIATALTDPKVRARVADVFAEDYAAFAYRRES